MFQNHILRANLVTVYEDGSLVDWNEFINPCTFFATGNMYTHYEMNTQLFTICVQVTMNVKANNSHRKMFDM